MNKYISIVFTLFIIILSPTIKELNAEQIGVNWEFDEENNCEGWEIFFGASDLIVTNGILQATASGWFPCLKSSEFDVSAEEYGIISLRMKVSGSSSARFLWETDNGNTGLISFPVYEIESLILCKNDLII